MPERAVRAPVGQRVAQGVTSGEDLVVERQEPGRVVRGVELAEVTADHAVARGAVQVGVGVVGPHVAPGGVADEHRRRAQIGERRVGTGARRRAATHLHRHAPAATTPGVATPGRPGDVEGAAFEPSAAGADTRRCAVT